jgi:hypothetical protein
MVENLILVLLSSVFGVLILGMSLRIAISNKKILVFFPFAIIGLFFLFYAGISIESSTSLPFNGFGNIFVILNVAVLAIVAGRRKWMK